MRHPSFAPPITAPLLAVLLVACGGGSDDSGPTPPQQQPLGVALASPSGNGQTAAVGAQLPDPLRVIVRRGGAPAAGVTVAWTVASGGGSIAPTSTSTGTDGIASTRWTLGPTAGTQGAQAAVAGATGSPVSFSATATGTGSQNLVRVQNNIFAPATITVGAGATVEWEWASGSLAHNIVPVAPATIPNSPTVRDGPSTYQVTFPTVGRYDYYCQVHGTPTSGMRGTVVVQ